MKINELKYNENYTDCICNLATCNNKDYIKPVKKFYDEWHNSKYANVPIYKIFQDTFGKQQITKQYTLKSRIWTFTEGDTTIYCLINTEGISWEYNCENNPSLKNVVNLVKKVVKATILHMNHNVV